VTGRLARNWSRLNGPARVQGVDLARGLAVVGMFAAHMLALPDLIWTDASTWGGIADGRSSILFATLAGVSLALVTGGSRPIHGEALTRARWRIVVRAGLIWTIGLLLIGTTVPVLVILPAYGILFVLATPFLSLRPAALFGLAGSLALVMPFVQALLDALPFWSTPTGAVVSLATGWHYPFPVWIAFVLCGLGVGRLDLRSLRVQALLLAAGSVLAVLGYVTDALSGAADVSGGVREAVWTARPHSSGLLEVIGSGGFAVAAIGLCLLICRTALVWLVLPLRATGSMPLSAYTAQLLVWALVGVVVLSSVNDLGGFRALEPFLPLTVWTVLACTVWALVIGRGPLETVVDRGAFYLTTPSDQLLRR
jgi:hypothetical protein